jgi:hypothetical protein
MNPFIFAAIAFLVLGTLVRLLLIGFGSVLRILFVAGAALVAGAFRQFSRHPATESPTPHASTVCVH